MAYILPLLHSLLLTSYLLIFCQIIPSFQINSNQFQSARQLFPLRSYRDVQIVRFQIPNEVQIANWRFNASVNDGSYMKNYAQSITMRSCEALDISFHLRWGSLPTININNASFPENFIFEDSQQYLISLKSDSRLVTFNITNPLPGDWFGLSYLNVVDDRISQKGLGTQCQHKLTSSLSFSKVNPSFPSDNIIVITPAVPLGQKISHSAYYKFYTNSNCFSAKLVVHQCAQLPEVPKRSGTYCPIVVYSRAMALPNADINDFSLNCSKLDDSRDECAFDLFPVASDSWNYIQIEPFGVQFNEMVEAIEFKLQLIIDQNNCIAIDQNDANSALLSTLESQQLLKHMNSYSSQSFPNISLDTLEDPFRTNYIKLTRYDTVSSFEFKYSHVDATSFKENQSVSVFFDIPNDRISVLEFGIIPQSDIGGTLSIDFAISPFTNTSHQNYSITFCLEFGRLSLLTNCLTEIKVNTSSTEFSDGTSVKSVLIPYPRPGNWFISLKVECYHQEFELMEDELIVMRCDLNKTSILLDITSAPCLHSKCGNRGKCLQYLNGGILYSSCSCKAGWKGWICNDGSQAIPEDQLLLNFLLLTLSNIMFIPAVILSTYRKHFTEALVYLTTMTSSTLYHACDSDYPQSYCVVNMNVLQFGDFYSAILAFWVTLVTLANMPDACRTFFHLFGGIMIAFAVELDRTSLWAFALPAGVGGVILIFCWLCRCCHKTCYPSGRLWIFSILPGIALTAGGLVVYAFFETQENYAITHSCWHAIMALALLFLVPSMKSDGEDDEVNGKVTHMQNAKLAHVEWRPSHTSFKFLNDDIDML